MNVLCIQKVIRSQNGTEYTYPPHLQRQAFHSQFVESQRPNQRLEISIIFHKYVFFRLFFPPTVSKDHLIHWYSFWSHWCASSLTHCQSLIKIRDYVPRGLCTHRNRCFLSRFQTCHTFPVNATFSIGLLLIDFCRLLISLCNAAGFWYWFLLQFRWLVRFGIISHQAIK